MTAQLCIQISKKIFPESLFVNDIKSPLEIIEWQKLKFT